MKLLIFVIMLIFILRLKKNITLSFKNNDTDLFNNCSIKLKN